MFVPPSSTDILYYYLDPEFGCVTFVEPGINGRRWQEWLNVDQSWANRRPAVVDDIASRYPLTDFLRTNPPPNANFAFYISDATGQWRKEPAREPELMREGIHAALGGFLGIWLALGLALGGWLGTLSIVVVAVSMFLFVVYEVSEGWRIRDNAYRDVGGALTGFLAGAAITGIVTGFLLWP